MVSIAWFVRTAALARTITRARVTDFLIRRIFRSHSVHRLLVRDATSDGFLESHALRTALHLYRLYIFWSFRKSLMF